MPDDFLVPQPNGQWARIRAVDDGTGRLTPVARGVPNHPGYVSGRDYCVYDGQISQATVAAVDTLYFMPFMVEYPMTPTHISISNRGPVVGGMKAAIWAHDLTTASPAGLPLFANASNGEASTNSVGGNALEVTGTARLVPGLLYWIGAKFSALPAIWNVGAAFTRFIYWRGGTVPNNNANVLSNAWLKAHAFATDLATLNMDGLGSLTNAAPPVFFLRAS